MVPVGPVRPDVPVAHPPSLSLSDFTPRESEHPAARRAHIGNGTCSRVYSGHSLSVLSVRLPHTHGPVCPPRAVQYTLVPTCVYSVTAYPHQTPPQKHEWPRGANTTSDRPAAAATQCARMYAPVEVWKMHVTAARRQITRCLPHVKASDPSRPLCAPGATRTSGGDPGGERPHKSTDPHVATWALRRDAPIVLAKIRRDGHQRSPQTVAPPSPACRPA